MEQIFWKSVEDIGNFGISVVGVDTTTVHHLAGSVNTYGIFIIQMENVGLPFGH